MISFVHVSRMNAGAGPGSDQGGEAPVISTTKRGNILWLWRQKIAKGKIFFEIGGGSFQPPWISSRNLLEGFARSCDRKLHLFGILEPQNQPNLSLILHLKKHLTEMFRRKQCQVVLEFPEQAKF